VAAVTISNDPCLLCELAAHRDDPGDTWVLSEDRWFAGVLPGYEAPGWVVCGMRRHGEGPDSMNPVEAAEFGVVVQRVSAAIREATGAERIYLIAFGEHFPHLHFMLVPRPPGGPDDPRGVAHLARREELRDPVRATETANLIRSILNGSRNPEIS